MYDQQITCRVTNGGLIWSAFYVVSQSKNKASHRRLPFFDIIIVTRQVPRVMVKQFHQPIVFGN